MNEVAIYTVNITCITLMVLLVLILLAATRLKGGAIYVALIILICNTPVYLYNMSRSTEMYELAAVLIHIVQLNALLMPLMWLFVRRELDPSYRFCPQTLFHFIPSALLLVISLTHFLPVSQNEFTDLMLRETTEGEGTLIMKLNDTVIAVQVFVYFPLIFRFIKRTERKLKDRYSDSDYLNMLWVKRVMIFFAVQFLLILIVYTFYPQTDVWFIPVMNLLSSSYLVYNCITYPTTAYLSRIAPDMTAQPEDKGRIAEEPDTESMASCCRRIEEYLNESKAFKNSDFSLAALAIATGMSSKMISRSINGIMA